MILAIPLALPAREASADVVVPPAAQELSLDALGIGAQTVYGPAGVIEIYFPAPAAQLAAGGSYVRIFFSHSENLGDGSGAVITMNGQPLPLRNPVALQNGTAAGGVAEYPVGPDVLHAQAFNKLRIQFTMKSAAQPPPSPNDLFGRLDGRTLIHYQLAQPGSGQAPGLETYPYSLLPTSEQDWTVGVVLPSQPDSEETGAALRILADLGHRSGLQAPAATLVADNPGAWLAAGGRPAVIVGRFDRLPSAADVLKAAGWTRSGSDLSGPGGRVVSPGAGLVASLISPWDHRTPMVLVTGAGDAALARAVGALVGSSGVPLSGSSTVADRADQEPAAAGSSIPIELDTPEDLGSSTPSRYRSIVSVAAPAVDAARTAQLTIRLPSFADATLSPTVVTADLDGQRIGAGTMDPAETVARNLQFSFPARMLRSGNNVITLDYQLRQVKPSAGGPPADNSVSGTLTLPQPAAGAADLRQLPFPFLEKRGSRPTVVVLTDAAPATLSAAGQALLSLGTHAASVPPRVASLVEPRTLPSNADLIVVGSPPPGGQLANLARTLPESMPGSVGSLQQVSSSDGNLQVLWVGGSGDSLASAARALAVQLEGQAVTVDASGHVTELAVPNRAVTVVNSSLPKLLPLLAALVLAITLGLQLVRPRARGET